MIQLHNPNEHITQKRASIQSPHDPHVFIDFGYNDAPVLCLTNGTDRPLSALEFGRLVLEWASWNHFLAEAEQTRSAA